MMAAKALLLAIVSCCAAVASEGGIKWSRIGPPEQVKITDEGGLALKVEGQATAGAISEPKKLPPGADAILVEARIGDGEEYQVTISAHDGDGGQTVGYWQNLVPLRQPTDVAALLALNWRMTGMENGKPGAGVRLFVGTDGRATSAEIEDIRWRFVRSGAGAAGAIWACIANGEHHPSQSFVARGKLAAVKLRLRHSSQGPGPGLKLILYPWRENVAQTRKGEPIGTGRLEGAAVPAGEEGNERDVAVGMDVSTESGKTYLVEVVADEVGGSDQKIVLWGGPGEYEPGKCFDNDREMTGWDLYFQTYYEAK
ncbi:MAG: hypothetical protein IT446_00430 [Phycisphaerales bacterium]|nr:hypothetical protein [Phycisphaerales bacterium]